MNEVQLFEMVGQPTECRFDEHEHKRGDGRVPLTVHREAVGVGGSSWRVPPSPHPRDVRRACEELEARLERIAQE